jgi:hypothetical protein
MKNSTISFTDADDETVFAEYYVFEDGWVMFKTSEHKAVAAYPERRVASIKVQQEDLPAAHQRRKIPGWQ